MPRIVLLNGTPSSGQTTLATALQEQLSDPYWHLSLDDFLAGYRDDRLHQTLFSRTLAGYLPALREMVTAGNNVIAEAIIMPGNAVRYFELFGKFTVYFVGVRCPPSRRWMPHVGSQHSSKATPARKHSSASPTNWPGRLASSCIELPGSLAP